MGTPFTIYILHTYSSQYASQGYSPSGKEGYDIWLREEDDEELHFLGWIPLDDLVHTFFYYKGMDNCTVKVKLKPES